jgi:hypothetical protein
MARRPPLVTVIHYPDGRTAVREEGAQPLRDRLAQRLREWVWQVALPALNIAASLTLFMLALFLLWMPKDLTP